MTPPPPLSCAVCDASPASLQFLDLEAEQLITGARYRELREEARRG